MNIIERIWRWMDGVSTAAFLAVLPLFMVVGLGLILATLSHLSKTTTAESEPPEPVVETPTDWSDPANWRDSKFDTQNDHIDKEVIKAALVEAWEEIERRKADREP